MLENEPIKCLLETQCQLGEGALWDSRDGKFWFCDIKSNTIHSFCPNTKTLEKYSTADQVGFLVPHEKGGFVIGLKTGLHYFDPANGEVKFLIDPEPDYPNNRLNDATISPDGAIFFGTMDDGESECSGAFYRYDGKLSKTDDGICITNGPCFSPDGKRLYTVDTAGKLISVWDVENGIPTNKRLFADLNDQEGFADGPVCDSLGNVWIGLFFGWGVRIYSPQGELIEQIKMPVSNVTKVAFGGEDLKSIFITTARIGLSQEQLKDQPLAGAIFELRSKVPGFSLPLCNIPI